MAHLIDKDAVLAEIKERIETYNKGYANGDDRRADALEVLLHDIDTLEVKEVQEKPVSDDFTKALAECIMQAQGSVVDPLVHAETWKDELIKLAKSEEPVSTKDKLLALSDGRLHLEWIDDAKVVEFEKCLMQFHEDMNNIPQDTDSLTRLKDTDGVLHSYSKKLMSMAKEEIKAIKFKAGDKIRLINDDGTGIQTIKKVIRDGYLTTEMLRIKLKDENQWVRVDDNFEGRFEEKEIELSKDEYISWGDMSEEEKAEFFKSNPFKIKKHE